MSLETNLELNNQLVTRNNELLERLISALASGVVMHPDTVAKVQEYREPPEHCESLAEAAAEHEKTALSLDDLTFSDTIALAAFYPVAKPITEDMLQRAIAYRDAEGDQRVVQIDALDSALQGVKRATELLKPALLDLSRNILKFWDELPTTGERRAFAERLLDAPPAGRDEVKPKKAGGKGNNSDERTGPFYCKSVDGTAASELHTLRKLNAMLEKGHIEINRVEYLQLQEEFARKDAANNNQQVTTDTEDKPDFAALRKQAEGLILQLAKGGYRAEAVAILEKHGAQKLGGVADEKLADVIAQAEKALEG
ncbi:TPA: hypothetical protein U2L42_004908 [Citrobacter amalonaticus]|uniref:hypothetical protein n=1 Tax=Citrobacter TaxID=544 RepID=UPI00049F2400|nr:MULTISPECIES: hypothetical protein [Citrobacter]ELN9501874.1 hypothetical protein [Citrobacter amalonaticus]ELW9348015.1 hypothetical protein [Citrobacter amalonaticus]KDF03104.1 hypothetical protein AF41_04858 [Citrobacter sp. MGH 55]WQJ85345.1 hypothetical protein U4W25_06235 [Citrobacter amalonaticus]GJK88443.1 hypothetical protein TUM17567_47380 [Citrobacter amalonaticus]